jgi:siroheme synthase-like protein
VAVRRTRRLLHAGAQVTVIAPALHQDFDELATSECLRIERRVFEPADLDPIAAAGNTPPQQVLLVIVATNDSAVNNQVGALCAEAGILVNRADLAQAGDLSFPATVHWGSVSIAVSDSEGSPALSQWVARRVDASLESVLGLTSQQGEQLAEVIAQVRQELQAAQNSVAGSRRDVTSASPDWRSALDESILVLVRMGRCAEAKERLLACLSS